RSSWNIDLGDGDMSAFRGQPLCVCTAEAASGACDDDDVSLMLRESLDVSRCHAHAPRALALRLRIHREDRASLKVPPSGYEGNSGFCAPSMVRKATSLSPSFRTPRQMPAGIQIKSRAPSFRST